MSSALPYGSTLEGENAAEGITYRNISVATASKWIIRSGIQFYSEARNAGLREVWDAEPHEAWNAGQHEDEWWMKTTGTLYPARPLSRTLAILEVTIFQGSG
jgi:hypothetical protein